MELRHYLEILKRHRWFLVEAVVVVGLLAGIASAVRTPIYQGAARVLLRPNDPSEQINPADVPRNFTNDPDRYVSAQEDIVRSKAVATEAAKSLPGLTPKQIISKLSVAQAGQNDVLEITATDVDPAQARDIPNAVAKGYIENRRLSAVAGLQRATDEIGTKLGPVQARIAQLDAQIGEDAPLPTGPAPSTKAQGPTPAVAAPAPPVGQVDTGGLTDGALPTSKESLKAARYAAALQYQTLYARQQELLVDISLKRGEAELISLAETPTSPISPHPKRDAALGAVVGLMLGVGISLVREQLNDRVRSSEEIEQLTGLPVLAQLPFDAESVQAPNKIAVIERPLGPLSEAVRALRTSIQFMAVDDPIKVIVVTSAGPNEGKSLVAANLAAAYAQGGSTTYLVAADLRRPTLSAMFPDAPTAPGLSGVFAAPSTNGRSSRSNGKSHDDDAGIAGTTTARTAARRTATARRTAAGLVDTPLARLRYLPPGVKPPNPAELLGSQRMEDVLEELTSSAQMVVIDTPPLLAVTDAAILGAKVDGVVLVAAVNETSRDAVKRATAILEPVGARLLGVIVNKAKSSGGYYYAGYYGEPKDEKAKKGRFKLRRPKGASGPIAKPEEASSRP